VVRREPRALHAQLDPNRRLLVEDKPFEPAFCRTDIADWGMALHLARAAGPQARVLVDTGHHYAYADDDLTLGSIDPYQVFRIFHEIASSSGKPDPPRTSVIRSIKVTTLKARSKR
jgi:L-rhamnose isomerase/sugar isomerase